MLVINVRDAFSLQTHQRFDPHRQKETKGQQDALRIVRRREQTANVVLRHRLDRGLDVRRGVQAQAHVRAGQAFLEQKRTEKDVEPERRIVITNEELKFNETIGVQLKSIFNTTLSGGDCNQIRKQLRPLKDSYKRQVKTELMSEVNTLTCGQILVRRLLPGDVAVSESAVHSPTPCQDVSATETENQTGSTGSGDASVGALYRLCVLTRSMDVIEYVRRLYLTNHASGPVAGLGEGCAFLVGGPPALASCVQRRRLVCPEITKKRQSRDRDGPPPV